MLRGVAERKCGYCFRIDLARVLDLHRSNPPTALAQWAAVHSCYAHRRYSPMAVDAGKASVVVVGVPATQQSSHRPGCRRRLGSAGTEPPVNIVGPDSPWASRVRKTTEKCCVREMAVGSRKTKLWLESVAGAVATGAAVGDVESATAAGSWHPGRTPTAQQ